MSKFIIRSLDSYNEKSFEIVTGKKIQEQNCIVYEYDSRLGKCKISFLEDKVIIDRDNNGTATLIEVNLNRDTEFIYYGEGFKKKFFVKGEKITYKQNILEFSYKILDNGEEINSISIAIKDY